MKRAGDQLVAQLSGDDKVNGHRPSVDVLFHSAARVVGARCAAALLTGMGDDGARGLKALRDGGAYTIAQDEATSVVWGMPRVAAALGGAVDVLPLDGHRGAPRGGVAGPRSPHARAGATAHAVGPAPREPAEPGLSRGPQNHAVAPMVRVSCVCALAA